MNQINLVFSNPNIKNSYLASQLKLGSKFLIPLIISLAADFCLYAIPNFIVDFKFDETIIIFSIVIGFFIVLSILFLKKFPKFIRPYTLIILLVYSFTIVELLRIKRTSESSFSPTIIMIIQLNMCLNLLLFMNYCWIYYSLLILFVFIDLGVRCFSINDKDSPKSLISFAISILIQIYSSYTIEKSNKLLYKEVYESNEFLITFQNLIKDVLPSPIIIKSIEKKEILFINNAVISTFFKINNKDGDLTQNAKILDELLLKLSEFKIVNENDHDNTKSFDYILTNFDQELKKASGNYLQLKAEHKGSLQVSNTFNLKENEPETRTFDLKIQKIIWKNTPSYLISLHDITNMIELTRFKDLDLYKNRLLATVSHDLRTPVNGILGIIETVENRIVEKRDRKLIKMAKKIGNLLICMINDILDFSKISNLQLRLNFENVDLLSLLKDIYKLFKFQAKSKGLYFKFTYDNLNEYFVNTDENRVKQILLNLLSNALKFTFNGGIHLILEKISSEKIKITVEDTGIGIKDDDKPKLFKLFGKLNQENNNINKSGVGLGLVISESLAKMLYTGENNGINFESTHEKGSKFWFFLENKIIDNSEHALENFNTMEIDFIKEIYHFKLSDKIDLMPQNKPSSNIYKFKNLNIIKEKLEHESLVKKQPKILIVDDDQMNLLVAKEYMLYFGLDYILANNGKEALNKVEEIYKENSEKIDIILMDCNMPIMDGFTASIKIKQFLTESSFNNIPIIALTANVSSIDVESCFEAGMEMYLCKPVSRAELSKILSEILKIKLPI